MNYTFALGTAAELIKMYPLIRLSRERGLATHIVATGQSREGLLRQWQDFGEDERDLSWLLESDGDLTASAGALRWFVRAALAWGAAGRLLRPGYVLVHGDTLSTLVAAAHGWRLRRTVVHVEAGLRSPSVFNPFPEEIDRRLVSRLAHVHCAPDRTAVQNLGRAGVSGHVFSSGGNTLMDVVLTPSARLPADVPPRFVLANVHRFENLTSAPRWSALVDCVVRAAARFPVLFVMHPQTRHRFKQDPDAQARFAAAGVRAVERLPFSQFIALLQAAEFVISDGGSNQEECAFLGKPLLLLRAATERPDGLGANCVLSRFDENVIGEFLAAPETYVRPPTRLLASPSANILDRLQQLETGFR